MRLSESRYQCISLWSMCPSSPPHLRKKNILKSFLTSRPLEIPKVLLKRTFYNESYIFTIVKETHIKQSQKSFRGHLLHISSCSSLRNWKGLFHMAWLRSGVLHSSRILESAGCFKNDWCLTPPKIRSLGLEYRHLHCKELPRCFCTTEVLSHWMR